VYIQILINISFELFFIFYSIFRVWGVKDAGVNNLKGITRDWEANDQPIFDDLSQII
jgi:hypothetical protein